MQPHRAEWFRLRLGEQISMLHQLVKLAALIGWPIERTFAVLFTTVRGRPALAPRRLAASRYLQHTFDAFDETVVNTWVGHPFWQFGGRETCL